MLRGALSTLIEGFDCKEFSSLDITKIKIESIVIRENEQENQIHDSFVFYNRKMMKNSNYVSQFIIVSPSSLLFLLFINSSTTNRKCFKEQSVVFRIKANNQ